MSKLTEVEKKAIKRYWKWMMSELSQAKKELQADKKHYKRHFNREAVESFFAAEDELDSIEIFLDGCCHEEYEHQLEFKTK